MGGVRMADTTAIAKSICWGGIDSVFIDELLQSEDAASWR
jgi:hypothetical protein